MYEAYKNSRNTLLLDILKPHHVFFFRCFVKKGNIRGTAVNLIFMGVRR